MATSEQHFTRCIGLAVIALGIFVYANTLDNDFVWDDASSILLHQTVQDPSSTLRLFQEDQHAYAGGQGNFYRPLLAVTFLADFWLSYSGPTISQSTEVVTRLSPLIFHLDSIFWHCMAAVFLLLVLKNFKAPRIVQAAVPLIYVVHPLHTEAVSYMSGRADSMSAAFMFSGLFLATTKAEGRKAWLLSLATFACFVAGLISKESSFIFPALLFLAYFTVNRINEQKSKMTQWATLASTVIALGIYALLRTGNGPLNFGSDTQPPTSTFSDRIIETVQSFSYYIQLLFNPSHLHMERTLTHATAATTLFGFASLAVCLFIVGYGLIKKQYRIFFGSAWFLVTWLPISGLFPLNAPMAEHWMYVPMAGFLWFFLELILDSIARRLPGAHGNRYRIVAGVLLINWCIHLAMVSIERNEDWSSNVSIYEATLRENPKSSRVHFNLAVTYQDLLKNNEGAKRHFGEVVALYDHKKVNDVSLASQFWDEEIQSHFSLGQILLVEGNYSDASKHFIILSGLAPEGSNRDIVGLSLYGLGRCFLYTGNREQAQKAFEQAIGIIPTLAPEIQALF